jgi:hypothetical protein
MSNYSKIVSYALSMTFGPEKVQVLTEICEATPNAEIAIEKLLNIYEEPFIAALPHADCKVNYLEKQFISYDKWNDRVHFKAMYNYADKGDAPIYKGTKSYCTLETWNKGDNSAW